MVLRELFSSWGSLLRALGKPEMEPGSDAYKASTKSLYYLCGQYFYNDVAFACLLDILTFMI